MNRRFSIDESPLLGAYLIWRFVQGYSTESGACPNVLLIFPALAISMTEIFAKELSDGMTLPAYSFSFYDACGTKAVSLSGVQSRIETHRDWILKSLEFAMTMGLVRLDLETAQLSTNLKDVDAESSSRISVFTKQEGQRAERVGGMFARSDEKSLSYYLGIKF